jgi:hypothetical protein
VEQLLARRSSLTISEYHDVAAIRGEHDLWVEIKCVTVRLSTSASSLGPQSADASAVAVRTVASTPWTLVGVRTSFLDFDECQDAVVGLALIDALATSMARESHEHVIVTYQTKGELGFGFVQDKKQQSAFVLVGTVPLQSTLLAGMDALTVLREALMQGQDYLVKHGGKPTTAVIQSLPK